MSFMEGFGKSFSQSFENARTRRDAKEAETFRMTYSDYLDRRKTREKYALDDGARIRNAKTLSRMSGAPEDSWATAYELLQSGMSSDEVMKTLRTGSFEKAEGSPTAPVAQQTVASGLSTPAPTPEAVPSAGSGNIWDNIKNGLLGPKKSPQQRAYGQIAEATGRTPEEIEADMSSDMTITQADLSGGQGYKFTPAAPAGVPDPFNSIEEASIALTEAQHTYDQAPTPENQSRLEVAQRRMQALQTAGQTEAQWKARAENGGFDGQRGRVPDGQGGWKPIDAVRTMDGWIDANTKEPVEGFMPIREEEQKAMLNMGTKIGKPLLDYNDKKLATTSILRDYGQLGQLVASTDGAVLAPMTAGTVNLVDKWANDINEAVKLLTESDEIDEATAQAVNSKIDKEIAALGIPKNAKDLANAKSLFDAKAKILAYRVAASLGQEGNALSKNELANIEDMLVNGTTEPKFWQNASALVISEINNLKNQQRALNENNADLKGFEAAYGWMPMKPATGIDEDIAADSSLKGTYEKLKKSYNFDEMQPDENSEKKSESTDPYEGRVADGPKGPIVRRNGKWYSVETNEEVK